MFLLRSFSREQNNRFNQKIEKNHCITSGRKVDMVFLSEHPSNMIIRFAFRAGRWICCVSESIGKTHGSLTCKPCCLKPVMLNPKAVKPQRMPRDKCAHHSGRAATLARSRSHRPAPGRDVAFRNDLDAWVSMFFKSIETFHERTWSWQLAHRKLSVVNKTYLNKKTCLKGKNRTNTWASLCSKTRRRR